MIHMSELLTTLQKIEQVEAEAQQQWNHVSDPSEAQIRLDQGFHSAEERRRAVRTGACQRLSKRQCLETPAPFRDLLLSLARACA